MNLYVYEDKSLFSTIFKFLLENVILHFIYLKNIFQNFYLFCTLYKLLIFSNAVTAVLRVT